MFRNINLKLFIVSVGLVLFATPVFAANIIIEKVDSDMVVWCPFDVDVFLDADWDKIQGSTINVDFLSWMILKWFLYGETINVWFPIIQSWNNLIAYGFKFPGTFTWIVKFATLRVQQNDKIDKNSLKFNWNEKLWDSTDFMDVHLFGWKDNLKWIENQEFIFVEWSCPELSALSWDQLSSMFDQKWHLMDLYKTIDDYLLLKDKNNVWLWIVWNVYYVISLLLLIIIILMVILYKKWKLRFNKILKNNSAKNV